MTNTTNAIDFDAAHALEHESDEIFAAIRTMTAGTDKDDINNFDPHDLLRLAQLLVDNAHAIDLILHPELADPSYIAWCDEQAAIHEGLATELTHCYLCHLESTGRPAEHQEGPLRGILRHGTHRTHPTHPEADVYDTLILSCGHTIL